MSATAACQARHNRYIKRISYGNRVSRLIQPDLTHRRWMFEVVFDYDEGHYVDLDARPDEAPPSGVNGLGRFAPIRSPRIGPGSRCAPIAVAGAS